MTVASVQKTYVKVFGIIHPVFGLKTHIELLAQLSII